MIVPKKLNSGELNGLEWILPKLEQDNMLEVPKISYTYKNSQNQITQKLSNCRQRSNPKLEENEEEIEINMAIIEILNIDKHKTLLNNRDKIIDLIFNDLKNYLDE